jgi:hypothetical protein
LFLIKVIRSKFQLEDKSKSKTIGLLFVIALIYIGSLSLSPKKTIRYILPVMPMVYVFSVLGWKSFFDQLVKTKANIFVNSIRSYFCFAMLLIVAQGAALCFIFPQYLLYYNPISGGVKRAFEEGHSLPLVGQKEVINFLDSLPREELTERKVKVIGDVQMMQISSRLQYRPNALPIKFMPQNGSVAGYYVLVFYPFIRDQDPNYIRKIMPMPLLEENKVFSYEVHGIRFASIFYYPMSSYQEEYRVSFEGMMHATGYKEFYDGTKPDLLKRKRSLVAKLNRDKKGYITVNYELIIPKGTINGGVLLGIPKDWTPVDAYESKKRVIKFGLTPSCERIVTFGELSSEKLSWIDLKCDLNVSRDYRFKAYWYGAVPVILSDLRVKR